MSQLESLLRDKGLRATPQREAILEVLNRHQGQHLDVPAIHAMLSKPGRGNNVSGIATVYRTVELFDKLGLVARLEMENAPARYEIAQKDTPRHHHLVCLQCGQVIEIEPDALADLAARALRDKDFLVSDKPVKIYGLCAKCQARSEQSAG